MANVTPRGHPFDVELLMEEAHFGFALNQGIALLRNAQRSMRQPGVTHLMRSCEEARRITTRRKPAHDIDPREITGGPA